VETVWHAEVDSPLVALTFDDGPQPQWTPMVLDELDRVDAPATFFMIGEHLRANRGLVAGRLDRHEVGNHTWSHPDLAELDHRQVHDQLRRAEDEIVAATGTRPRVMRPPWGHLGGSTLLAANAMRYDVILWSQQMSPRTYGRDTAAQVANLVQGVRPGSIILAHDVGDPARLPGLRGVGDLVTGLRAAGLRLVTVSELMAARRPEAGGRLRSA
jgi:peptidoglycan/xylan/chitin deacetylase (PgdA/CDA1 family)